MQGFHFLFLSSLPHGADSSVASVESFRSFSWYFSTRKTRGMPPSFPWLCSLRGACCMPWGRGPPQPPTLGFSHLIPPQHPSVWCGMVGDAFLAGQQVPVPKHSGWCPFPLSCSGLLHPVGLGLILARGGWWWCSFGCWQTGICRELLSSSEQFAAIWSRWQSSLLGTAGHPSPSATLGES